MTNVPEYRGTARKFGGGDLLMQLGRLKEEKTCFADWITANTYLRGKPFSFAGHEYQIEIANDTHPLQAIQKCVQIGISETLIRKFIAFFILNDGRQGIYTFPTREGVRNFVKTRVNPTIQETPMLRSLDQDVDSVDIKQFGKSFLHFKGTFGERESIAVPSDFNIIDELNYSKPDTANMFRERMEHSDIAWEINCSRPTIPQYGISELYEQSDQKKFFIKCNHCNHWQNLFYSPEEGVKSNIVKGKKEQNSGKYQQAHYICIKCLREINYDPNIQTQWVAKFPERTAIRGYAVNQLAGWAWKPALSVVNGVTRYKKISDYYNAVLGLPYADPTRKLTRTLILDCVGEHLEQSGGRNCFMAADQGKPAWAIIAQYDEEKEMAKIIHFEKVDGDMFDSVAKGGVVKKGRFSELMELYDVMVAVIDAQPNSETANNMAKKYPGRVFPCYYAGKQKEQLKWTVPPDGDFRVTAHRTETMDTAVGFWKDKKVTIYPQDNRNYEIYETFIEHLTGIVKVIDENDEGKRIIVWRDLKGGRESHFAHVWNYLCMAIRSEVNLIQRVMVPHLSGLGMK